MRMIASLVATVALSTGAFAQNGAIEKSGAIGTEVWDFSEYVITGPISVEEGEQLTISMGVQVHFAVDVPLEVYGTLRVMGDQWHNVVIAAHDTNSSGTWGGIRLLTQTGIQNNVINRAHISGAVNVFGGAVMVDTDGDVKTFLQGVVFEGNSAQTGGAVGVRNGDVLIARSIFWNNEATGFGDEMLLMRPAATNGWVGYGGAIANESGTVDIVNCTFYGNNAYELGSVYAGIGVDGVGKIENTIIHGNSSPSLYNNAPDSWARVSYSMIPGPPPAGFEDWGGNLVGFDPMFYDPLLGDFSLTSGSRAIDGGNPDSPHDPDGTRADMGAIYYHQDNGTYPPDPGHGIFAFPFDIGTPLTAVALHPMGPVLAFGKADTVEVWAFDDNGDNGDKGEIPEPEVMHQFVLPGRTQARALEFTPDGTSLLAATFDGYIYGWNEDGSQMWTPVATGAATIYDLTVSPTGTEFAVSKPEGDVAIHSMSNNGLQFEGAWGDDQINALAYSVTGDTLFGAGMDGAIYAWEAASGARLWKSQASGGSLVDIQVGSHGHGMVARSDGWWEAFELVDGDAGGDGMAPVDGTIRALAFPPQDPDAPVWIIALDKPDGRYGIEVWTTDFQSYYVAAGAYYHQGPITGMSMAPNGEALATVGADGRLVVYGFDIHIEPPYEREHLALPGSVDNYLVPMGEEFTLTITGTIHEANSVDLVFSFDSWLIWPGEPLVKWTAFDGMPDVEIASNVVENTVHISIATSEEVTVINDRIVELRFIASEEGGWGWLGWMHGETNVNERWIELWDGHVEVAAPPPLYGDVTGDGTVSAQDASHILQFVVKLVQEIHFEAADVSANGWVTGYDAALVLKRVVNPDFRFPAEDQSPWFKPSAGPIELAWSPSGESWALELPGTVEVVGADLTLRLPSGAALESSGLLVSNRDGDLVRISIASIDGSTELLRVNGMSSMPELVSASINEHEARVAMPVAFDLAQNAPNPFNPSTTIRFAVPDAGPAMLGIYDVNGRLVRTLVDGAITAGTHEIVWDGRDAVGRDVASGVYVYRLRAGENVATRKLTLVR